MNPRMVAIAGSHRGETFTINGDDLAIGRAPSSWICIPEPSVSRKHCVILSTPEGFQITDNESRNGTFVNGIPIRERVLCHGDRIEVGGSVFLFLVQTEEAGSGITQQQGDNLIPHSTIRLGLEQAMYLEPERMLTSIPLTSRMAAGLGAIMKLSRAIQSVRDSATFQRILLESAFRVIPADHSALILRNADGSDSISAFDRQLAPTRLMVSRSLINEINTDRAGLLSNDIDGESATSLIATPLIVGNALRGVLYLETSDKSIRFDEDHLHLASAIGLIGGLALENIIHLESLQVERDHLLQNLRAQSTMIGESAAIKEVYSLIARVASADATVLITGESGTGKELAARAIHLNSARASKAFVAINCATLSETLLESELFGHEKGAFTGAVALKKGKLEVADGGSVFLDEASEIPPSVQAKLLRVLQQKEFERVGGTRSIRVDVRWIAATNSDLQEAVRKGTFRQDLYYRLNIVRIPMPALRERREDIPLLASFFIAKYGKKSARRIHGLSPEARRLMILYDWPGNVRELENAMERAVILGNSETILPEDLPEMICEAILDPDRTRYQRVLQETKRKMIHEALEASKGNHMEAARILGVHPNNLYRMMKTLQIK